MTAQLAFQVRGRGVGVAKVELHDRVGGRLSADDEIAGLRIDPGDLAHQEVARRRPTAADRAGRVR